MIPLNLVCLIYFSPIFV